MKRKNKERDFPVCLQREENDCGLACIRMICKYYRKPMPSRAALNSLKINNNGISLLSMSSFARSLGFLTLGVRVSYETLAHKILLPCIVHLKRGHYTVVFNVNNEVVQAANPESGLVEYKKSDFIDEWIISNSSLAESVGICLIIGPAKKAFQSIAEGVLNSEDCRY